MNDSNIWHVIVFSLIGGVLSLIGGFIFLINKKTNLKKFSNYSIPFAAGALLGAVFFDLLKDGLESSTSETVLMSVLIGFVGFFALERLTHWFHHHHDGDDVKQKSPLLIIIGDTLHNALDGVAIASSFLISVPTGIVTTIAVAAHEIPHEIGDFGVLLSKGLGRKKVLFVNLLSALATTATAVIVYILGDSDKLPVGMLLGLSAGFLLYIAASDLIPTIHQTKSVKGKIDKELVLLLLGLVTVWVAVTLSHKYIDVGHADHSQHEEVSCTNYFDSDGTTLLHQDCIVDEHHE